ncbi:MAG: ABC transporter permease [Bryobacteraceae bacterium]|nr:ABC transporter permease [Bryobacteraceae bacterium]
MSWRGYFRRDRKDADLARELDAYLEQEIADQLERGLSPPEAEAAARRKLGNRTRIREEIYTMNTPQPWDHLLRDLRYGVRGLLAAPGFTLVAIISLGLGIGANTAMFQLFEAIRLRTLPVEKPWELVDVTVDSPKGRTGRFDGRRPVLTDALWERIRGQQQAFSSMFAFSSTRANIAPEGEARRVETLYLSGEAFSTLGVRAHLGRLITPADDTPQCAEPAAVLGYAFWRREYGGDPAAVGKSINIERRKFPIVGVAERRFPGLEVGRQFDLAIPVCAERVLFPDNEERGMRRYWWLSAFGRLKPGWTLAQADAHLKTISPEIFRATAPAGYTPEDSRNYLEFRLQAREAARGVSGLRRNYGDSLGYLLAATGVLLLIACANLANLLLARGSAREREFALRLAIGASRRRLVAQMLTETALLVAAGAALGVLCAGLLSRTLVSLLATEGNRWVLDLSLDWRVLAFAALLAALSATFFGLLPALRASRAEPSSALHGGGRSTGAREGLAARRALVALQVALATGLLAGALLLARTLHNLSIIDPGFRQSGLLVVALEFPSAQLPMERRALANREILDRLRAAPGVDQAAQLSVVPGLGWGSNRNVEVPGETPRGGAPTTRMTNLNAVSDGYFAAMGTPLRSGRDFDARDRRGAQPVAIVNEEFARRFFGGRDPVGRVFRLEAKGAWGPPIEVIGLAADSKYENVRDSFDAIAYLPIDQQQEGVASPYFMIHSRSELSAAVAAARSAVAGYDPQAIIDFAPHQRPIGESLVRERLMAALTGFFGFLAVTLAVMGLYGVISFWVSKRRTEIGIRVALGATRRQVVAHVVRETALLAGAGLILGLGLAILVGRAAQSQLFGVAPNDPLTLASAVLLLGVASLAAGYVPARQAAKVDPAITLRQE